MLDSNDLLIALKKAALDAMNASQPCDFCFGKVTSVSPLAISIEQKMTLGAAQLILTRNVTDYQTRITTEGEQTKTVTVHNALKTGDEVILMKKKGGQKYLVLDRMVNA